MNNLSQLTRGEMKARAIAQLDQAAAVWLEVEADLQRWNKSHPQEPMDIPERPAWLVRLLGDTNSGVDGREAE